MQQPTEIIIDCFGYSVAADWYTGKRADQILLVLIGWTSTRSRYEDLIIDLVTHTGVSALVLEYSGHGESPHDIEKTMPAQHFLEVIYAFDWLRTNYPFAHISVMGTSYGGYQATELTKYRSFDNLILRVPAIYRPSDFYTRHEDLDQSKTKLYRENATLLAKHPLLKRAAAYKGKSFVVVHELDEQIPRTTTDAYIHAFGAESYLAKGFHHSFERTIPPDMITDYKTVTHDWLNKQLCN